MKNFLKKILIDQFGKLKISNLKNYYILKNEKIV